MTAVMADLRQLLEKSRVDAFLVTKMENVRYLSGFTGSTAVLLVTGRGGVFVTDSRYATQSAKEVRGFTVQILRQGERLQDRVVRLVARRRFGCVGFEAGDLRVAAHRHLKKELSSVRLVPMRSGVEILRLVKSDEEVGELSQAIGRAEKAFKKIRRRVRVGVPEREIALSLEHFMRREGAAKIAFDTIVASGPRAAMPHGIASGKRIRKGELVIVDFGAESNGYFSDMTRTLYVGNRLSGVKRKIFNIVKEAQQAAIDVIRPGIPFGEIDRAARDWIQKEGYGDYFGHGTGHGIGLEVHESPGVTPGNEQVVQEGMVFTVEPGIYLPGLGGVRIEDMVLATREGCRVLTVLPRGWEI